MLCFHLKQTNEQQQKSMPMSISSNVIYYTHTQITAISSFFLCDCMYIHTRTHQLYIGGGLQFIALWFDTVHLIFTFSRVEYNGLMGNI